MGIGIDFVDVGMVSDAIKTFGKRYLQRVFTPSEMSHYRSGPDGTRQLAAHFAAKEAVLKALAISGQRPRWTSIELLHDAPSGVYLHLSGDAANLAAARSITQLRVSIGYTSRLATATVIATANPAVADEVQKEARERHPG